jgi:hypothetical protein
MPGPRRTRVFGSVMRAFAVAALAAAAAGGLWIGSQLVTPAAADASIATALCTGPQPDGTAFPGQKATCLVTPGTAMSAGEGLRVIVAGPNGAALSSCVEAYTNVSATVNGSQQCVFAISASAPVYTFGPLVISIPASATIGTPLLLTATTCIAQGCGGGTQPVTVIGPAARVGVASSSVVPPGNVGSASGLMICTGTGLRGSSVAGSQVTCSIQATQDMVAMSNLSFAPLDRSGLSLFSCRAQFPGVTTLPRNDLGPWTCIFHLGGAATTGSLLGTAIYNIPAGTPTGTVLAISGFYCAPPGCGGPGSPPFAVGGPGVIVGVVPDPPASTSGAGGVAGGGNGSGSSGTEPNPNAPAVSTIASSIATPSQAFVSVGHTVVSAAIAVGIILFITFPAALFNKTLEENYDEIRDAWDRRFGWARRLRNRVARAGNQRWVAFVLVLLIGAVLGGLLDPRFGFNRTSAITFGAVVLAILVGMTVPALVNMAYRRSRHLGHHAVLHALPAGLAVAALCVLVSRLSQFQPGYLYGVIAGIVFTDTLARREQGHAVAFATLTSISIAVIAWLLWIPVHTAATGQSAAALLVLVTDFLGALFAGGLVASVLSLLPFRFLPGGALLAWHKGAWAAIFGVALFGIIEIMLRPENGHASSAPLVTTIVLLAVAGALSVGFALYFSRRKRQDAVATAK